MVNEKMSNKLDKVHQFMIGLLGGMTAVSVMIVFTNKMGMGINIEPKSIMATAIGLWGLSLIGIAFVRMAMYYKKEYQRVMNNQGIQ